MATVKGSFHFYHCRTIPQVLEGEGEKQLAEVSVGIIVNGSNTALIQSRSSR